MAFSYGFYNSIDDDRLYDARQISELFDGILNDGVYLSVGGKFIVRESEESNKVIVSSGRAWFNRTWNYNDSDLFVNLEPPEIILNRIDAIVIDVNLNDNYRENTIKVIKGIPSDTPVNPELIKNYNHAQYPLAYIYRSSEEEIIEQANITNVVGTSECPFVTGILETTDIDDLLLQWQDQWANFIDTYEEAAAEWLTSEKSKLNTYFLEFKRQIDEFTDQSEQFKYNFEASMNQFKEKSYLDFNNWFEGVKEVLDQNVAGYLLNKIDKIETVLQNWEIKFIGHEEKKTVFNSDGSITEYYANKNTLTIVFESDGSISETLKDEDGNIISKKVTVFNSDGSISELIMDSTEN